MTARPHDPNADPAPRCAFCGAALVWHVGPQASGWRAPEPVPTSVGRDVCWMGGDSGLFCYGHEPLLVAPPIGGRA